MAASVTALLTELSDADTTTGWSGNSGGQDVYSYVEGGATPASYTWYVPKNSVQTCTFTPATNQNFTTNYTYPHLYFWFQSSIAQFFELRSASGFEVRLTDGSGNYTQWTMAGSDTWRGEWKCFILDTANTADISATSGTLSLADIDIVSFIVDSQNISYRNVDNMWNDLCQFGEGLKATGTTFDFGNIADIDATEANMYGILQATNGVLFCQGKIQIGDGATTTTFTSSGEQLVFIDPTTAGVGGGAVGSVNANLYELKGTGSGCDFDILGSFIAAAGSQSYALVADTTLNSFAWSGNTFVKAKSTSLFADSNSYCSGNTFDQCGEIDVNGCIFESNTINNTTETTTGAVVVNDDTDLDNAADITFNDFGTNYAIYVAASVTEITLDNFQFDNPDGTGGNFALYWAGTSGTLTVNASNGTNLTNGGCTAASGGSVTVQATVNFALTNVVSGTRFTAHAKFTTAAVSSSYNATGDSNVQFTASIGSSLPTSGAVRLWNGSYWDRYTYTGVSGDVLTGISPALTQSYGSVAALLEDFIAPTLITSDPWSTSVEANQDFLGTLANASGATRYTPINFEDNTGSGFARRIEQVEDA